METPTDRRCTLLDTWIADLIPRYGDDAPPRKPSAVRARVWPQGCHTLQSITDGLRELHRECDSERTLGIGSFAAFCQDALPRLLDRLMNSADDKVVAAVKSSAGLPPRSPMPRRAARQVVIDEPTSDADDDAYALLPESVATPRSMQRLWSGLSGSAMHANPEHTATPRRVKSLLKGLRGGATAGATESPSLTASSGRVAAYAESVSLDGTPFAFPPTLAVGDAGEQATDAAPTSPETGGCWRTAGVDALAGSFNPSLPLAAMPAVLPSNGSMCGTMLSGYTQSCPGSQTKVTFNATFVEECDDGTTELNQYVLLDQIGQGAQGKVFLAMDTNKNEMRAVKAVPRPQAFNGGSSAAGRPLNAARRRQREQLEREVAIMKRCRHAHVVRLYEVIDDPEQDKMFLVMQHVRRGSLAKVSDDGTVSRTVAAPLLAQFAKQLVEGLQYLHKRGIIHRDIKPENILLGAEDDVYLADFGVAEAFDKGTARRAVEGTRGTLAFVAPELLGSGKSSDGALGETSVSASSPESLSAETVAPAVDRDAAVDGEAVDVWALGVTLYALLYGELPFFGDSAPLLFTRIRGSDASFLPSASMMSCSAETAGASVTSIQILASANASLTEPPGSSDFNGQTAREWRALLSGMLEKNPTERWSLPRVRSALKRIIARGSQDDGNASRDQCAISLRRTPSRALKPAL